MLTRTTALAVLAMPLVARTQVVVWPVNGHAYQRVDAAGITWTAARTAAEAAVHEGTPGHLVTVNSAEENRFLTEHASVGAGGADRLERHWMGGYQVAGGSEPAGGWVWITGEEFAYTNWAPGEPNDWPPPPGEDRLLFYQPFNSDGKQWNDAPDNFAAPALGYVIEFEPSAAPSELRWVFQTGSPVSSCPAIGSDGTIYVGVGDRDVYALDGATGAERWAFRTNLKGVSTVALGATGEAFVAYYDRVYALDAATGKTRWESMTGGGDPPSAPAVGADGTVYVHSGDGRLYALAGADGQHRWVVQIETGIVGGPASAPAIAGDGTVYVGSWRNNGKVVAINGTTGAKVWESLTDGGVGSSPAIGADGTVYVGSYGGRVYALDGATGQRRWAFASAGQVPSSVAIGVDGTVFLSGGNPDTRVYALSGATGTKVWEFAAGGSVSTSPAVGADGTVYAGSKDHLIYALDAATGQKRWAFRTGATMYAAPAIGADGTVYVGADDGNLYALRGTSGLADSAWPKFRGNAQNTGRVAGTEPEKVPTLTAEPQDVTAVVGTDVVFVVAARGTPPLTYQWRKDGSVLAGSLEASLVLNNVRLDQSGGYSVVITNSLGAVTSRVATLTVRLPEDAVVWPVNGHAYQRVDAGRIAWADARAAAEAAVYEGRPGHLVTVTSAEENRFLTEQALLGNGSVGRLDGFWLGAYQPSGSFEPAGGWRWVTGEPFAFVNWAPGEPNNMSGLENAIVFWAPSNADGRLWNDSYERTTYAGEGVGYVIEYEPGPAPDVTPPTVADVSGDTTLTRVTVKFSEPVAVVTATNVANYALSGGLQVQGATMGADPSTVVLSTSTQTPQTAYTLTVGGVSDAAGNPIAPDAKVSFMASGAQGGGQFTFGNKNLIASPPIDAKMCYWDCATGLPGAAYWAQAYVKRASEPESSYRAVGQPVHFRTGANAGYIVSTVVTTPFPAGTAITVQMRAWETAFGDSYEEAQTNGGSFGHSGDVPLTVTVAPAVPPDMVGLSRTCGWGFPPVSEPPSITRQPSGVRAAVDTAFALSVSAANAAPDAYQWYRNGQPIFGANGSIVNVAQAQLTDAGDYHVTVTNSVGSATSELAHVVVGYPLTLVTNGVGRIEAQPPFGVFAPGENVALTAVPGVGRTFLGWGGDTSGVANPLSLTIEGPRQVVARFSLAPGDLRWQYASGASGPSTPALGADGTLYVACDISHLCALEPATGTEVWRFTTGGYISAPPTVGAGGTVLVGSWDGKVYALEGATGALKWTYQTGNTVESAPVVGVDGTVYFGCSNLVRQATITALDGALGTPKWEHATGSPGGAALAIGAEGTIYARASTNLFAIDGSSGTRLWSFAAPGGMAADPALGNDGTVYAKSWEGLLYALDGLTGVPQSGWKPPLVEYSPAGPVIGFEDTLLIPGGQRVYAFSALTGTAKWRFPTPDWVSSTPAIASDGTVYVASGTGTVYALDSATGAEHWRFETGALLDAPLALGPDGTVYVAAGNSTLYALQGTSGLAQTAWPKFHRDPQNTGHGVGGPPEIIRQPRQTVFLEGAENRITVRVSGYPPPRCQWFFNDVVVPDGTNATLVIPGVTRALEGRYLLVASNALGQATSAPIVAIVSNVDPQRFPGWRWEGVGVGAGTVRAQMAPSPFGPWYEFGGFPAGATAGYYIETNLVDAVRCYRLRAEAGETRFSATTHVPGWWYEAALGTRHRIEYAWSGSAWTNWIELTELTLPASPQLFLDTDAFDHPGAVYRTTLVP